MLKGILYDEVDHDRLDLLRDQGKLGLHQVLTHHVGIYPLKIPSPIFFDFSGPLGTFKFQFNLFFVDLGRTDQRFVVHQDGGFA